MTTLFVNDLQKHFLIPKRKKGMIGAFSSLFSRQYLTKTALDGISFEVKEGELLGFIGPNGAGKSTTIKILSGILVPDGGKVEVLGMTPWENREEVVRQIGVVFGQRTQLWWDLPVIESFELLKKIYRVPESDYERILEKLVVSLELQKLLETPVRQLSLGQRMRCDLAASLLHSPKILFLDEPTIGLDAVSKLAVRDFIKELNKKDKVTIILTTHDMDDIESLTRRILILNEGKIFLDGSIEMLRKKVAPHQLLVIDLEKGDDLIDITDAKEIQREGHRVTLSYNPSIISTPELIRRVTKKHAILDLFVENPPIEELIAKLYRSQNL